MKHILALVVLVVSSHAFAQVPSAFGLMNAKTVTPPTFVQEAETTWTTTTIPLTTASFNVNAGDILVAYAGAEHDNNSSLSVSGGSLTWTLQQSINFGAGQWSMAYVWTAVD